jgi:hypothetical protein
MIEIFNIISMTLFILEYFYINNKVSIKYFRSILFLHIICQWLFCNIIILSSILEPIFWYYEITFIISNLDKYIVSSLLNLTVISGILISKMKYKKKIPSHIKNVVNILFLMGIFWLICDKTTQDISCVSILILRIFLNLFSCSVFSFLQFYMKNPILLSDLNN